MFIACANGYTEASYTLLKGQIAVGPVGNQQVTEKLVKQLANQDDEESMLKM